MSFDRRVSQHDEMAIPIVVEHFAAIGFACYELGTETDSKGLHSALMAQYDGTSIMLRFRPDRVFIKPRYRSILCEIKSEANGYRNFAIEADSFQAAHEWDSGHERVMYAFVDLSNGHVVMCCWASDIPMPYRIFVPRRWDFDEQFQRMSIAYSGAVIEPKEYRGGSGTPYFLISKSSQYLRLFDEFMTSIINESVYQGQLVIICRNNNIL